MEYKFEIHRKLSQYNGISFRGKFIRFSKDFLENNPLFAESKYPLDIDYDASAHAIRILQSENGRAVRTYGKNTVLLCSGLPMKEGIYLLKEHGNDSWIFVHTPNNRHGQ